MKMKMKMKLKQAALAIAIYTMTVNVFAASDGTLSATNSTATLAVSMEVKDMIQITSDDASDTAFSFADATISDVAADGSETAVVRSGAEEFCVFVNGGGGYQLTISDSNTAVTSGVFNLASTTTGVTDNIPFQVTYTAAGKDATQAKLTARGTNAVDGTLVTGFSGYSARFCEGANNLAIWVDLLESDMLNADTAEYSTTLSFLVAVE